MEFIRSKLKYLIFLLMGNKFFINYQIAKLNKSEDIIILNLHRVAKNDGSAYAPLQPYLFEELLKFIKNNFEVTTFANIRENTKKPKMILSFDDGYKDFIDIACPFLYKYGIKVNQNIIPSCIEDQLPPLNVLAQDFVGKAPVELVKKLKGQNTVIKLKHKSRIFLVEAKQSATIISKDTLKQSTMYLKAASGGQIELNLETEKTTANVNSGGVINIKGTTFSFISFISSYLAFKDIVFYFTKFIHNHHHHGQLAQ